MKNTNAKCGLLLQLKPLTSESDAVDTPKWIARDIVNFFQPNGLILEPCKGNGVFLELLPRAEWCEIKLGRDFFDWRKHVDWIVTNPPYSAYAKFLRHALSVADNIVFLAPMAKPFYSHPLLRKIFEWGGMKHIRIYGGGNEIGFTNGFAHAAVHFQRQYEGGTFFSWYNRNLRKNQMVLA